MADEDDQVMDIPQPPRETDVLFGPGEDWIANACVNYGSTELAYRTGFRRAALSLAAQVCDAGRGQDFLVYPIVYLYRHHVELALKSIIGLACEVLDRALPGKEREALGRHDLAELWKVAKPLVGQVCGCVGDELLPSEDYEGIASYIRQLHEHDPDGQRFRYATVRAKRAQPGRPSLRPELRHINIRNFAVAMERLADHLDAIETGLDHLAEQKAEMRAEYARASW